MISFELIKAIELFVKEVDSNDRLLHVLSQLAKMYDELLEARSNDSEDINSKRGYIYRLIRYFHARKYRAHIGRFEDEISKTLGVFDYTIRNFWSRRLFTEIDNLEAAISKVQTYFATDVNTFFIDLNSKLSDFAFGYEEYLKASRYESFELIRKARELYTELMLSKKILLTVKDNLSGGEPSQNRAGLFDLILHPDAELAIIVVKLKSLEIIYGELCRLLNVSHSEHPLRVVKLETGSLWAKLFGESKVITLMTDLIRSGAGFIYRNFTNEGKLSAIPMKVEELETVINLEQRIREAGLDTTDMQESIRISGVVIAKQLNNLLSGEAAVTINHERLSVGSEVERMFIEKSKTLLLGEGVSESTEHTE